MTWLGALLAALFNTLVVSFVVRRLLGVAVGWPRTLALSLVAGAITSPIVEWLIVILEVDATPDSADENAQVAAIALLVLGWVLALEIAALSILEALVPTGSVAGPVQFVRDLPARRRRARRYAQISAIAARHGLGAFLRPSRRVPERPATARSLREALTAGGVTFVKLGQMLSTRPDLIGEDYVAELSRLQSDVPPVPWSEIRTVIESELGAPLTEVFAEVDEKPLAAASLGQIHAATLRTGEPVVVKVQRPGASAQVAADLDIVTRLAGRLDEATAWGRRLGVADLAAGFAASLREELDYRVEASNMTAVAATLEESSGVLVPRVWDAWTRRRVLVVERLPGQPVNRATTQLAGYSAERRSDLARRLLGCVLKQVLVDGVFHADLHPGNIFLEPDGTLGLLDFGVVGRLDRASRESLATLLAAVDRQDAIAATDSLIDLLGRPADLDDRLLERRVGQLVVRHGGAGGSQTVALVSDLFALVFDHGLAVPPQVAAAFRALGALEGTLLMLDPGLDLTAAARSEGRAVMGAQLSRAAIRGRLEDQLASMLPMLQRLPRRVDRISQQLEEGRLDIRVSLFGTPVERALLTGLIQQFVVAGLAAAVALCGVILIVADTGPMLTPALGVYTYVGFTLLLFGFVLGARALALAFRQESPRRSRREQL